MKKIIALFLTFSLLFAFASCTKMPDLSVTTAAQTTMTALAAETSGTTTAEYTAYSEATEEAPQTTALPATYAPVTAEAVTTKVQTTEIGNVCTVSISCSQIMSNLDKLKAGKEDFLPSDGCILNSATVEFFEGESAFDVFRRACAENVCTDGCDYCKSGGIQYEASYSAGYDNYYIEGIHQIYEKDCGSKSGWMYRVNGEFPNYGCSSYTVKNGDEIEFLYTCSLGEDIGNMF